MRGLKEREEIERIPETDCKRMNWIEVREQKSSREDELKFDDRQKRKNETKWIVRRNGQKMKG